jgi:membrane-bound lytic murein transglycosylase D
MRGFASFFISFFISFTVIAQTTAPKGDEVFTQRLASLRSPLDLTYNAEVKKYIDQYLENPEKIKDLLSQSKVYFPIIEKALKAKGIPTDLKYLAMAVSELNPSAENTYGASGQWMMMYTISKMYKLKVTSFIDERNDPAKSAAAAASHFKDLFSIYKQWPLAIAAYGCSPVMLNKCIRMANNSLYFWDVYPYIPENSKGLFPKVIATAYILNFYKEHGIKQPSPIVVTENDTIVVSKWLSLQQVSSTLDLPLDQLRKNNPTFKKDIIPYNPEGYKLVLPKAKAKQFALLKDSVYNLIPKLEEEKRVVAQNLEGDSISVAKEIETPKSVASSTGKKAKVYYTVKRGDNLGAIADWFDVPLTDVKGWNNLRSNNIAAGRRLQVFVDASKTGYYKKINTLSAVQKQKLRGK